MRHLHLLSLPFLCPMVVLASQPEDQVQAEVKAEQASKKADWKKFLPTHKAPEQTKTEAKEKPVLKAKAPIKTEKATIKTEEKVAHKVVKPSGRKEPVRISKSLHQRSKFVSKRGKSSSNTSNTSSDALFSVAFPFLLPGSSTPMQATSRNQFSRLCFRFIYAVTVNLTAHDDPKYFYNLFDLQCKGAPAKNCSNWSDELLHAIRKKMQAEKLLGKDGHIGRSKTRSANEEFEAHLAPSLTGITSYANWCNELYKDSVGRPKEPLTEVATANASATEANTKKTGKTLEPTKASKDLYIDTPKSNTPAQSVGMVHHDTVPMVNGFKAAKAAMDAKQTSTPTVQAKQEEAKAKDDGCICVKRDGKQRCRCDKDRMKEKRKERLKESSEATPFKQAVTKMKGLNIAEEASEAQGHDKDLDGLEKMLHKARSSADRHTQGYNHKRKAKHSHQ